MTDGHMTGMVDDGQNSDTAGLADGQNNDGGGLTDGHMMATVYRTHDSGGLHDE